MTFRPVVNKPRYLRCNVQDGLLRVFRSPVVRDSDEIYQGVAKILGTHKHEVVFDFTEPDPTMVSGSVHVTIYRLAAGQAS